jgi:UPF0755 protein
MAMANFIRHTLISIAGILLTIFVISAAFSLYFVSQSGTQILGIKSNQIITVEQGTNLRLLLRSLEKQGIVSRRWAIKLWVKLNPELASIKAGTYEVLPGETLKQLLTKIAQAKEKQWSVTLVEGLTWKQWKQQLITSERLEEAGFNESQFLNMLGSSNTNMEGLLLPDTYNYTSDTRIEAIVERAYQAMDDYLHEAWERRDPTLPLKSPYEVLILASIVEKETGLASERPHIAGVFVNRLEMNMRLQSDPTTIYGLGEAFGGDLLRSHLREKTPYNTYRINGLPPTPIAMVSSASIDAVVQPMITSDLYFVAKGDGSHKFSETLEEHNAAVRQYQINRGIP